MATPNGKVKFNEIPTGYPEVEKTVVYDDTDKIELDTTPLNGGFLVKVVVLSIDPYMRGRMRAPQGGPVSYSRPFLIGQPIDNWGVGNVIRSEHPEIKAGDHLYGMLPFQEYFVSNERDKYKIIQNQYDIPWSAYVGLLGMPGKTAYYGWREYAKPKAGETLFVSTAAGPVGSLVVQLAKRDGLKVIGSAGSDEKVAFLKEIGADVAFNYKTTNTREVLKEHGPINIYWDHVGNETLEAALEASAQYARFIECGMIASYNQAPYPIKNLMLIVGRSLTINGFIVSNLEDKYVDEFYATVPKGIADGTFKYSEHVYKGLKNAGQAIVDNQRGRNTGKSVIVL